MVVNNGITQSHRIGLESCAGQPLEVGWKVGGGTSGKEQKACKTNKQEKKGIIDFEAYSYLWLFLLNRFCFHGKKSVFF